MAMTTDEIQTKLDAIVVAMCEKGKPTPRAHFTIRSGQEIMIMTEYGEYPSNKYEFHESLDAAFAYVAAMPCPEESHRAEFLRLAAAAADYAASHLVDDDAAAGIRAAIVSGMKRMSENAITSHTEPTQDDYGDMNDRAEKLAEKWESEQ
jgi:hypothetical protein